MSTKAHSLFDPAIVMPALGDSIKKLSPALMIKNPVMFVTMVGAAVTTVEIFVSKEPLAFTIQISIWLWFTVLFANFAEAMAEGRGKAQANALRQSRTKTVAKKRSENGSLVTVEAAVLRKGDVIVVAAGEMIASDHRRIGHHGRIGSGHPRGGW
jgi:potassium-transporting ATPase ATP-binding subunit